MKAISLCYHDIIDPGGSDESGFAGPAAGHYKLDVDDFQSHLESIAHARGAAPVTGVTSMEGSGPGIPLYLTFDDGGLSALRIADVLDRRGWVGHFLITTEKIGSHAFLTSANIIELRRRGHVIGSHSHTHPGRMAALDPANILKEWTQSVGVLTDIVGEKISVASVPGGFFSEEVAKAAAAAGLSFLFTSEPTTQVGLVDGCRVIGRYAVQRGMTPQTVAAIASGKRSPRYRQFTLWNAKKAAKFIGGEYYLTIRKFLFARGG